MRVSSRGRIASYAGSILVGLIAARQAAARVRTVDILLLFAGGAAFGAGLSGVIRALRSRKESRP